MTVDRRRKDQNWCVAKDDGELYEGVRHGVFLAVLMDIRDELQTIRRLAQCHRIPKALDGMIELAKDARRRKRLAAKRRKAKRNA